MLFNSIEFLVFFPTVLLVHFLTPRPYRWLILLAASYLFYMAWIPAYLGLILASTLVDYTAALLMQRTATRSLRRACLVASLSLNLGLLFAFKYYGFFAGSAQRLATLLGYETTFPMLDVLLPVGISFYTFQTISYTVEVYLGRQEPERHLGRFALYVAYFPQLVAGPIERPGHLLPQLKAPHDFDYPRAVSGMRLILWGLFKKVVVADRLAQIADTVYAAPANFPGPALTVATLAFAFQILCDFSGYTDIAIGTARILGVDIMQNFRRPYSAHSIREFWQRWHISLSTWFRDYVFIPLGGSRVRPARQYLNIAAVFLLSGLWHGANWTFILWGAYHALLYTLGQLTEGLRNRFYTMTRLDKAPVLRRAIAIAVTFTLVTIGWVLFRANSLADALHILTAAPTGWGPYLNFDGPNNIVRALRYDRIDAVIALVALAIMIVGEYLRFRPDSQELLAKTPGPIRWAACLALAYVLTTLGVKDEVAFIYFQF